MRVANRAYAGIISTVYERLRKGNVRMIVEKIMDKLPVSSPLAKMIVGWILTALMISIGALGILSLFNFSVNPVIVAVLAVIGAAVYAASVRK